MQRRRAPTSLDEVEPGSRAVPRSELAAEPIVAGDADARRAARSRSRYAHQLRVVRSLSSSERTSAVTASSPRRSARGRPPRASRARRSSSCRTIAVRRRELADALRRRGRPRARRRPTSVTVAPCAASSSRSRSASGLRTRVAALRAREHLGDRRLLDQPAAVDDHDAVDRLRDLGEHVARDEDRAALGGERAQEVAQPPDPGRVEAVRRLVEHEHLRVAEQRRREAEALPHPERVALDAPLRAPRSARRARAPPRRASAAGRPRRPARAGGCGPSGPGWTSLASSTAPTRWSGRSSSPVRDAEDGRAVPRPGGRGRGSSAAWSTCRRRSGRGSR